LPASAEEHRQHERYPVAVLLHGGCWQLPYDLDYLQPLATQLTRLGFATWNLEYRRLGETGGGWPGTFQDVAAGMDYLRVLADRYPLDIHNVIVIGHSAGGQLALWLTSRGTASSESELYRADPLLPSAVIGLAPITDVIQYARGGGKCNSAAATLLGGSPLRFAERYRALTVAVPADTRVYLLHGSEDRIVPIEASRAFVNARIQTGRHALLKLEPDIDHFDIVDPMAASWSTLGSILAECLPERGTSVNAQGASSSYPLSSQASP
jgi:acetyl esterase/lipase